MSRFEKWLLRFLIKRHLDYGYYQINNLETLYSIIREIWEKEFPEDNAPTTTAVLQDAFNAEANKAD